uniref:DNA topoisomerase (ATP-hydrolyzing) n=1 Tax=Nicotiana sylvestris TaxID=4096 RepID=A0A1U7V5M2_NICSY|nr:PREDICTED: meiotic recombination protein SPO11-1 isoform X2 [Nicotiana sylvestris]
MFQKTNLDWFLVFKCSYCQLISQTMNHLLLIGQLMTFASSCSAVGITLMWYLLETGAYLYTVNLAMKQRASRHVQLVMGWLRYVESGRKIDCISNPNTAYPIPVHVEEVDDIISVAQYVLVVEKESVFHRLANDQFGKRNRCIVITGRGYPDVPTRRFLRLLVDKLHLPVYCLVDCDPYGFDILTTYKFGSLQMAYDAKFLRVCEIQWLGVFIQDCDNYSIPQQCLLPLTAEDKRKVEAMLLRCYLQREVPKWRFELELLLHKGVKFEIEALSVHSLTFLSHEYLPSKIQSGGYI